MLSLLRGNRTALARRSARCGLPDGVPEALSLEVDGNGSPVTLPPAQWFICFVPGLRRQWWHRFADTRHKHVFALRPLGNGTWLLVEPWWTRLMVNVLTLDEAVKFLRWGATGDILKARESIPGAGSQMRGWSNCSVLVAFLLGRPYWTWTPNGLYRKLLDEPDVQRVDLARFLSRHFTSEAERNATAALKAVPTGRRGRLDEALIELGTGVVMAMTSTSAIGLHRAAVSEAGRFNEAADAYWSCGPERAVERIRKVLVDAKGRSEIGVEDCDVAARRLLAMLRGDFYLGLVLGLRASPAPGEVRDHVAFAVRVFLRGAAPARDARAEPRPAIAPPTAQALIREIGESVREIIRGDDWDAVSAWAEVLWSEYVASTGLSWQQASGRIRRAWESYGAE